MNSKDRIKPWTKNPRYWQYKGKPVLLLGGESADNLFQEPKLKEQMDTMAAAGGNYVRCTMRSYGEQIWAFEKVRGVYDLNKPSREYWKKFRTLLDLAFKRNIIPQVQIWDRFDCARRMWDRNPFNPRNNRNYTEKESGLPEVNEAFPWVEEPPFFYTVPGEKRENAVALKYQKQYVDKLLSISLDYPNILYYISNETFASPIWSRFWSDYIKARAKEKRLDVHITEMWAAEDLNDPLHRNTADHPETYSYCDFSQVNHNKGESHWDLARGVISRINPPRPVNSVKVYGSDEGQFGNERDGEERFWRLIFAGFAGAAFHSPESGLGNEPLACKHFKSMRMVEDAIDIFNCKSCNHLLLNRSKNQAYGLLNLKKNTMAMVFFHRMAYPHRDKQFLDTSALQGDSLRVRWWNVRQCKWISDTVVPRRPLIELISQIAGISVAVVGPE